MAGPFVDRARLTDRCSASLCAAFETLQDDSTLEKAEDVAAAAAAAFRSSLARTTSQPVEDDLPEEELQEGEIEIPVWHSHSSSL